jgi:ketosteroid isomerase-like protein
LSPLHACGSSRRGSALDRHALPGGQSFEQSLGAVITMTASDDNKRLVREAFRPWEQGDSRPFFDLIAEDVRWTMIGSTPVSGAYESKQALVEAAFGALLERLDGALCTRFVDLAAEGDKVFLRFESSGVTRTGLRYEQVYCFAMVMREQRIVEIVAYLDTELLAKVFS